MAGMANAVTMSRFVLLLAVLFIAYNVDGPWLLLNVPLVILIFISDGIDGYVARKRHEESLFGAVFDIAADRIVEYVLWVALADLDLVPIWVPLVFIVRGTLTDAIRSAAGRRGQTPFGMMRSRLGRAIVVGGFMRSGYAVVKAVAFCWLLMLPGLPDAAPSVWSEHSEMLLLIGMMLTWLAVVLCILRGVPVVMEFTAQHLRMPQEDTR